MIARTEHSCDTDLLDVPARRVMAADGGIGMRVRTACAAAMKYVRPQSG
ncbi:hypothetical protein ACXPWS_17330 [Mycobacterium sp. BMJ-28]